MSVKTKKKQLTDASTQRYLPFSQIKDNVMMMKDNSARVVMQCSTINFLLKNSDEQDAIIMSFQRFLNSLDFPIQILVRSQKLDIDTYLSRLNAKAVAQKNPLLQNQTYEYIEYLKKLIEVAQIMKKEFYIIIPFDTDDNKSVKDDSMTGMFNDFWKSINQKNELMQIKTQIKNFSKVQKGLAWRVNSIKTGLENMWIQGSVLEKHALIKFLTQYYNPSIDSLVPFNGNASDLDIINN